MLRISGIQARADLNDDGKFHNGGNLRNIGNVRNFSEPQAEDDLECQKRHQVSC